MYCSATLRISSHGELKTESTPKIFLSTLSYSLPVPTPTHGYMCLGGLLGHLVPVVSSGQAQAEAKGPQVNAFKVEFEQTPLPVRRGGDCFQLTYK